MSDRVVHVDPETRGVFVTPELMELVPEDIAEGRSIVDNIYRENPEAYVRFLGNSMRRFPAVEEDDPRIEYSVFFDERLEAKTDRATLVLAPLNDCAPKSSNEQFASYLLNTDPSKSDREKAQPNSWRQTIKSADIYETHIVEGLGRPVATLYSPVPNEVFNTADRKALAAGITSPFGAVAERSITRLQRELHGGNSETQINKIDIYAPGMGHNAIGVAHYLQAFSPYEVTSLTVPNLIAGISGKVRLLARYSIKQNFRELGEVDLEGGTELALPESAIGVQADRIGSERAMRSRNIRAMLMFDHLSAMMQSGWIAEAMGSLLREDVKITIPTAYNASITEFTESILPEYDPGLERISIRSGILDKNANLMTNEYITLGSILALYGAKRAIGA